MSSSTIKVNLQQGKKIYFASDFHLGVPTLDASLQREKKICQWLEEIKHDAQQIYLVGDLFDSWMEYKRVVPKGFVRFLGKLAQLSDSGIEISVFTGNHDLWMHGYFEQELNIKVYKTTQTIEINNKLIHIGHGDGVCSKEAKYIFMKKIFHHPISQFIYRQIHPDVGIKIADYFSRKGLKNKNPNDQMKSNDQEYQLIYANQCLQKKQYDYFIFGHRHIPISIQLNENSTFINLGDWINHYTYAVFETEKVLLKKY